MERCHQEFSGLIFVSFVCSSTSFEVLTLLNIHSMSRIGLRVIISHHLNIGDVDGNMYGIVNNKCCPASLVGDAIESARSLAYQHYGESPEVEIRGRTEFTFPYVDNHLYLCLFEILKNSLRATCETHLDSDSLPPVRVIISEGKNDISVRPQEILYYSF